MRKLLLPFLLGIVALAQPLSAQEKAIQAAQPRMPTTVTVMGTFPPAAEDDVAIPLPLLERLGQEPALVSLQAGAESHAQRKLALRFAFASIPEFTHWYERPETRELLRELEAVLSRGSLAVSLSVERPLGAVPR